MTAGRDYYFRITDSTVTEFDPSTLSGINSVKDNSRPSITVSGDSATGEGRLTVVDTAGRVLRSGNGTVSLNSLTRGAYIIVDAAGNALKVLR